VVILGERHSAAPSRVFGLPREEGRLGCCEEERALAQSLTVTRCENFDYMSLIGGLAWLCKTRVDVAWRVSDLSRFTNRPARPDLAAASGQVRATVTEELPGRWSGLSWIERDAQPELRPPEQDHSSHGRGL